MYGGACTVLIRRTTAVCSGAWFCLFLQKREAEYDKFLRDKMVSAKNEFRALLRESKHLSHK